MHEYNIAQNIADAVQAEIKRQNMEGRSVGTVRVVIGRRHQLVPESLARAYGELTAGTAAAGSRLEVIPAPIQGTCAACGWSGDLDGMKFACGKCGGTRGVVSGGREMYIDSLEVEE